MAYPIYANDIGGVGQMLAQRQSQRDQVSAQALATLMQALGRQQQQQQFQSQMAQQQQMERARMEEAARRDAISQAYQNRLLDEYYLPSLKAKTETATTKDMLRNRENALRTVIENRMPYNESDFADLPEDVRGPMTQWDKVQRQLETEALAKAKDAAEAGNRLSILSRRIAELKKAPRGSITTLGERDPVEMAAVLEERYLPMQRRYAPLLDPKAKMVEMDPRSGQLVPMRDLTTPWMRQTNAPAATAPGKMPSQFYGRVNQLIDSGMDPREAKAQALSEFAPK